jgi:hypothetical protein
MNSTTEIFIKVCLLLCAYFWWGSKGLKERFLNDPEVDPKKVKGFSLTLSLICIATLLWTVYGFIGAVVKYFNI